MDLGQKLTEKKIEEVEKRINDVYKQAEQDIKAKMKDFALNQKAKEKIYEEKVKKGEMSQNDFNAWKAGQVFQGEQWLAKKEQITNVLYNANSTAVKIVNGETSGVFAGNANYMAYSLEHGAGVNFGFGLYDNATVSRLLLQNPDLLPPKAGVDKGKDTAWNSKNITSCVTQGIIQGESTDAISDRIAEVTSVRNRNSTLTYARTAMTGAQNGGRLARMDEAERLGLKVQKEWMATFDGHTRDSHQRLDGESVPIKEEFSNGCMYPGDPGGPRAEVYNCRCTMVEDLLDYPSRYERYDNVDGTRIEDMTYNEWYESKGKTHQIATTTMDVARRHEKGITRDLSNAVATGDGHLEGLDFKFKSRGSLERKIADKSIKKGLTQEEYAKQITDALRYTNVSNPDTLSSDYMKVVHSLESRGYSMVEVVNTLQYRDAEYRGVNTLVQSPDGYVFELQFHTPQSLETEEVNHKLYEEQRKIDTPEDVKRRLGEEMITNNLRTITPINIHMIADKLLDIVIQQW